MQQEYTQGDHNTLLIGDSGYSQQPWLMTPILGAEPNSPQSRYNNALKVARSCIESCHGVLKT